MATWTAFLRAINLGANRKFSKVAIKAAVESCGFADVETYINTGNVRFRTAMRSRPRIEEVLERAFRDAAGFEVPTVVLTTVELRAVADDAASMGHDGPHYVSLLKHDPAPEAARALEARSTEEETVVVRGRAVHLLLREGYRGAPVDNAVVERHLGVATNRNLNVIRALAEKWG